MILGNGGIRRELDNGNIAIEPFNDELVNLNSYDVRIDAPYYSAHSDIAIHILIDSGDPTLNTVWHGPHTFEFPDRHDNLIPCVVIPPLGIILATTIEVVGGVYGYTTLLKAKSTIARLGLDVCASAGFGDVGYVNKWTLEIINHFNRYIYIPVGTRIAQIAFTEVDDAQGVYEGSYVQQKDWDPSQMLPLVKSHIRI